MKNERSRIERKKEKVVTPFIGASLPFGGVVMKDSALGVVNTWGDHQKYRKD